MDNKLKKIKDNKKSEVYECNDYKVKISDIDAVFYKRNADSYIEYDSDLADDALVPVKAVKLEITSKITGKTTQKRCYQGYGVINDVQKDLNGNKKQFADMFKKIDPNK